MAKQSLDAGFEEVPVNSELDHGFEEVPVSETNEEGSDLGDLAKSVGQGALLGGGDEVVGFAQSLKDYITDPKVKGFLDTYRKHQKENEAEYEKVKERSPVLSTIGEIGGGLALPVGSAMGAAKGLGLAGKALLTGGIGATAGALSSKGTIDEDPSEIAKDAALGSALGVGAELGLAGAGKVVDKFSPAIKNYVQDSPKLRQILTAFQEGNEGKGFTGNANRVRLQEELEQNASNLGSDLDKMKKYGQEQYSKILSESPPIELPSNIETLKTVENLDTVLNDMTQSPYLKQMKDVLSKLKNGEQVQADEVKNLQKFLRDNQFVKEGAYQNELSEGNQLMNSLLNKIPGYSKVNELHGAIQDPISSFIKNVPAEEMNIASRPKSATIDTNTYKAAEDVLKKSELPYGMGDKQSNQLRLLKEGLEKLKQKDSEALNKMGINNIDDYFKNIQKQSDVQAIGRGISKAGEMNKNILDSFSPDLNTAYKGANIAGQASNKVQKISQSLYKAPVEQLQKVAESLSNNPNTKHLGTALQNTLQNPTSASRNAILFSIMQNPEARKNVEGMIPGVDQDGQQQ